MKHLQIDPNGNPMPVFFPGTKTANATITVDGTGASAATTNAIHATENTVVRLLADADCHIAIDTAPTATVGDIPLTAGLPEYFVISAGAKIAVLGATLYITAHTGD